MPHYDAIVLGLGAMGSATVMELARRGHSVLGIEQYNIGHDRGSSHGQTRVIRKAYFEDPAYVPMAHAAFVAWFRLQEQVRQTLLVPCPCLNVGPSDGELIRGVKRSALEHQLQVEHLTAADLLIRYPQFRFDASFEGVLEHDAGYLYVEDCVLAMADAARNLEAELHEEEKVTRWSSEKDTVRVETERGEYTAKQLIITAGPWAGSVLAELKLPLVVRRKPILWFNTKQPELFEQPLFPIFIADTPEGCYYGIPAVDDRGFKIGRHDAGEVVTSPDMTDKAFREEDETELRSFMQRHLPEGSGERSDYQICHYTMTPDQHFVIDTHPFFGNVHLAAGFSGHGFKFAPVIGEMLADLAMKRTPRFSMKLFRVDRFTKKAPDNSEAFV